MVSQYFMLLTVSDKIDLQTMKRKRSKRKAVREDRPMLLSPRESQVVELMGKRNALLHSFGSYRMEMVKNAGQVALEMGNSAAIVMKHYFDIVESRAAKEYWNIRPLPRGDSRKIVSMR
jgi:hypothetical protein